jgi:hypothetical protein
MTLKGTAIKIFIFASLMAAVFVIDMHFWQPAARLRTEQLRSELEALPTAPASTFRSTEMSYKSGTGKVERYYSLKGNTSTALPAFYEETLGKRGWVKAGSTRSGTVWINEMFCRNNEMAMLSYTDFSDNNSITNYSLMFGWGAANDCPSDKF